MSEELYHSASHCKYLTQYHIIWCPKFRFSVLQNGADDTLKNILANICNQYGYIIKALEVMPDHIHLLVDCKPQLRLSDAVKILKGNTARWLFLKHPEVKQQLWGGHLWNPSYCAVTVSDRSREQVLAYIEGQKEKSR